MLRFLYQGNYDDMRHSTAPNEELEELREEALLTNVKVYVIADKNNIPALQQLARDKYAEIVGILWQSECFMGSMEMVLQQTPPGDSLRKVVIATAATRVRTLIEEHWFIAMLEEQGELAVEVLKGVLALNGDIWLALPSNPIKKRGN